MIFGFGDFEFDDEQLTLSRLGNFLQAPRVVSKLLAALLRCAGEVITREQLIEQVWKHHAVAPGTVTAQITKLRKLLRARDGHEYVETLHGRGYRFVGASALRRPSKPAFRTSLDDAASAASHAFVGRTSVLARLDGAVTDAWRGRGRVCLLMGEPGIGKTRVAEALAQRVAGTRARVSWAFCHPPWDASLSLWTTLVHSVTETMSQRRGRRDLPPSGGDIEGPLARDRQGFPLDGLASHTSLELFLRAVSRSAAGAPRLLILEDLHCADAESLALLSAVIEEIAQCRLVIIATLPLTTRTPAPRADTCLPYLLGHRNCERIFLDRLAEPEVNTYLSTLTRESDGSMRKAIREKSSGHPLAMTEIARQMLRPVGASVDFLRLREITLAPMRHLEGLDAEVRDVLAVAAVLGPTFELGDLRAATGKTMSALMVALDRAIVSRVLRPLPDSKTAFGFEHEILRSVLRRAWRLRSHEAACRGQLRALRLRQV